jgi:O-antigen/teichoic acid export membrane protein
MAVGFFLAPFIVHSLGVVAYGVWVLAISSVSYLSLLDLGMRSSVLRFVSKGHTKGDHTGASDAVSAALWVRVQISAIVLLLCGVLALNFDRVFHVPAELATDARTAVMIIGVTMAFSMTIGVFGGVLSALNRYDLNSTVVLVQLAIRVTGVVTVLRTGHGIVAIALCELGATLVGDSLLIVFTRRIYPELRVRIRNPNREVLKQLWSYSFYAFLITVAVQLVYQTDNLVVGAFVSTSAVTFYSIGNSLCRYTDQLVGAMTLTFVPAASTYEAAGDTVRLSGLYRNGTRAMMSISLPILVTLMTRGRTFIGLWMGPQYVEKSGTVLIILATALFFSLSNNTAGAIAYGIEKHKMMAKWAILEAISNLTLSITLAHWYGIYGVALGTLIPSLFVHLILWPIFFSRLLGMGSARKVWEVWIPMFLAAIPFAVASYAANKYLPPANMAIFFLQTAALLPIFLVTVGFIFREYVRSYIFPRVQSFFVALAN